MLVDTWTNCFAGLQSHWSTSNKNELVASTLLWRKHIYTTSFLPWWQFSSPAISQVRSLTWICCISNQKKKKKSLSILNAHQFVLVKVLLAKQMVPEQTVRWGLVSVPWRRKIAQGLYFRWGAVVGENPLPRERVGPLTSLADLNRNCVVTLTA